MKKVLDEWVLDINLVALQRFVFQGLIHKSYPLTGKEVRFRHGSKSGNKMDDRAKRMNLSVFCGVHSRMTSGRRQKTDKFAAAACHPLLYDFEPCPDS